MAVSVSSAILNIEPIDLEYAGLSKDLLKDEVALITGAASNIGLGYARAIAWAGGKTIIADINERAGTETECVINEESGRDMALFVKCDVTQKKDIEDLAEKSIAKFGKVDILINNAMNVGLTGPVLGASLNDLEIAYSLSGRAVMLTILKFVPEMLARNHGTVVFSSSQFHYSPPLVGGAMYCAGKAIGSSITMSLANEVNGTSVNVFCLTPAGVVRFDANRQPRNQEHADQPMPSMPGFNGMIPPEAAGAAMVYCLMNASTLHGSGISVIDAFNAMGYPYPNPATVGKTPSRRLTDRELTLVLMNMGPGFSEFNE